MPEYTVDLDVCISDFRFWEGSAPDREAATALALESLEGELVPLNPSVHASVSYITEHPNLEGGMNLNALL